MTIENKRRSDPDEAPLNPALTEHEGDDYGTEHESSAPLDSVSVESGTRNPWPVIWYMFAAVAILLALFYMF